MSRIASLTAALEYLAANRVDAVVLDLQLPDGMGLECVSAVRRAAPDLPIIVLTGSDDEALALACISAGAQDYVSKHDVQAQSLRRSLGYAIARANERTQRTRADALQERLLATVQAANVELQQKNDELTRRDDQMRSLTKRLHTVRDDERLRISRTVHDDLGQLLAGLKMDLGWIARRSGSNFDEAPLSVASRPG